MSEATLILSSCVFQPGSELNSAVPRGARGPRCRPECDYTRGGGSWFVDAPYSLHLPVTLTEYVGNYSLEIEAFNDDAASLLCLKIDVDLV